MAHRARIPSSTFRPALPANAKLLNVLVDGGFVGCAEAKELASYLPKAPCTQDFALPCMQACRCVSEMHVPSCPRDIHRVLWQAHWCLCLQGSQEPEMDSWGHPHGRSPAVQQGQPAAEVHLQQQRGHRHHGRTLGHAAGPYPTDLPVRGHPGKGTVARGAGREQAVHQSSAGSLGVSMPLLPKTGHVSLEAVSCSDRHSGLWMH